jgi:hypothetical protein
MLVGRVWSEMSILDRPSSFRLRVALTAVSYRDVSAASLHHRFYDVPSRLRSAMRLLFIKDEAGRCSVREKPTAGVR